MKIFNKLLISLFFLFWGTSSLDKAFAFSNQELIDELIMQHSEAIVENNQSEILRLQQKLSELGVTLPDDSVIEQKIMRDSTARMTKPVSTYVTWYEYNHKVPYNG